MGTTIITITDRLEIVKRVLTIAMSLYHLRRFWNSSLCDHNIQSPKPLDENKKYPWWSSYLTFLTSRVKVFSLICYNEKKFVKLRYWVALQISTYHLCCYHEVTRSRKRDTFWSTYPTGLTVIKRRRYVCSTEEWWIIKLVQCISVQTLNAYSLLLLTKYIYFGSIFYNLELLHIASICRSIFTSPLLSLLMSSLAIEQSDGFQEKIFKKLGPFSNTLDRCSNGLSLCESIIDGAKVISKFSKSFRMGGVLFPHNERHRFVGVALLNKTSLTRMCVFIRQRCRMSRMSLMSDEVCIILNIIMILHVGQFTQVD